jgi:hypothetical protein
MPFTIEEFRDLVRILEQRPEWRAELRRLVLTDELLALPEQVASFRAETERRFQELAEAQRRTEEQVAALAEAQRRTEERVGRTEERMGKLEEAMARLAEAQRRTEEQLLTLTTQVVGLTQTVETLTDHVAELREKSLEADYRTKAYAYFGRLLRRIRVLSPEELASMLDNAVDTAVLSDDQAQEIFLADAVVRGRRQEDGTEVYLVVEVSWGVGPQDVERAVQRAELLAKTGIPTLAVVAGRRITDEAARLARTMRVWQVTDGRVVPPGLASSPS